MDEIKVSRVHVVAIQIVVLCVLIALWQFLPDSMLDSFLWSRPLLIYAQAVTWLSDGTLLWNAVVTFKTVLLGLVLGSIIGLIVGILAGMSRSIGRLISGPVEVLFALPKITLVPLLILWLGVGQEQHIIFTALVVFFFFFFSIYRGITQMPEALTNAFALMGATTSQRLTRLILPSCMRWLALAMRLAVPYAFVSAVSTEVIASSQGLGNLVKVSASVMDAAGMFAAMLALVFMSLAFSLSVNRFAEWVARNS